MNSSPSVILITGAGSGIGRQLATLFAQEGHTIAAIDIREEGVRSLENELRAQNRRSAWECADVTDPAGLQRATQQLETKLGPTDVLIANAGIGIETTGLNYNVVDMNNVLNVNLLGVSNSIGAVLPGMIARKRGHLVAISSIASYRGLPRMLAYCASKAGVNSLMDGLRVEVAPFGIHATTICPGWVKTPMTAKIKGPLDNLVEVEVAAREIAYAIRHKLSFYTFPRQMRWRLGFLTLLPRSWQDRYIQQTMNRLQIHVK